MRCVSVHLTDLCNSRCSFCVVGSPHYSRDSIDIERVRLFLTQNAGKDYEIVNLHGGEATIHPRFIEILELIRDLGYTEVHLQTNAIKLADASFAQQLCEMNVRLFIISLHGHNAQTQDVQTGTNGGFRRSLDGIKNVKAWHASVRTNTVITNQNVRHLRDIVRLACDVGVDHINFSSIHPVGSATFAFEAIVPSFEEVREQLFPAIDEARAAGKVVTLEGFPYCTIAGYTQFHLNESPRHIRMLMRDTVIDDYDRFMNQVCRTTGEACGGCAVRDKCGGVYPEYVDRVGWGEFHAING